MDGVNDFIVLGDVSPLGFGPASRQSCIDWAECTVILKTLANFHAISFAYKDQRKEEFVKLASSLKETYFGDANWKWYERFHVSIALRGIITIFSYNSITLQLTKIFLYRKS